MKHLHGDPRRRKSNQIQTTSKKFYNRRWGSKLCTLNQILGLEVDRTDEGLFLCQKKYTRDMLQKFNMLECKQVLTLIETNAKICAHGGVTITHAKAIWILSTLSTSIIVN